VTDVAKVNIGTHLLEATRQLLAVGAADNFDEARLEAELLYGKSAKLSRAQVIAAGRQIPSQDTVSSFKILLLRRIGREPFAYIVGQKEFYGLMFEVGPGVLIPRPETETLVEATLATVAAHPLKQRIVRVADAGTGSGAVALSIARHALTAQVFATDISSEALAYAGRNRAKLKLMERVVLLTGDLLEPLSERLDVIVANLPYIPTEEFERLPTEIRVGEPQIAVDGGEDGLDLIRRLVSQLPEHITNGPAAVLLELGGGQAGIVGEWVLAALGGEATVHRDLAGNRRVLEVRRGF
jgi:release factor glutamine methyltransferase